MSTTQLRSVVNRFVHAVLVPIGYRKRGDTFVRRLHDVSHVINVQSHKGSTAECVMLTVNLGIYSEILAAKVGAPANVTSIWYCHWQERLGFLMPEHYDKWWSIADEASAEATGAELAKLLVQYGLPALDTFGSTADLIALWKSDRCPGLSEVQRIRYLGLLRDPE